MRTAARFTSALYLVAALLVLVVGYSHIQRGDPMRGLGMIAVALFCGLMALWRARQVR